jgi:hypothetical protein
VVNHELGMKCGNGNEGLVKLGLKRVLICKKLNLRVDIVEERDTVLVSG